MIVSEYEREFVRLSKYAIEWVPIEDNMCKHFEEELNKDIKLLIGILELREFMVLADRAHKVEELSKEKKQAEREARVSGKRFMGRPPRHPRNVSGSQSATKDSIVKSEARAPARTYAIRAREDASAPDVIAGYIGLASDHDISTSSASYTDLAPGHEYRLIWLRLMISNEIGMSWYSDFKLARIRGSSEITPYIHLSLAVVDDVESNAPTPAQGTMLSDSRPMSTPQVVEFQRLNKPPIDKIRKYGVKEFRATVDDDPERAKFWLENTIRVCDELSCTPAKSLKCVISFLRDIAYQ
ncbi:protein DETOXIFICATION 44, chloroplastic-like [Gossypium australe]|uniref:Protein DETOXIFICATION 44, chloroplastic-like n=1 Tax=Gossypium australe TaxID=47621 RepID=A0A5B6VPM5_9ROSI|nr:protein DETOXIFICATION 44, chloroplastic-like [Gossypium australe]